MVVEFYAGTGGFARRFSGKDAKFRPGIPGIAPGDLRAARLDYAAAYASVSEPCPTELDGIGHAEELEVTEVGAGEIAYGNVAWADGSLSETGYWEASRPVRSKNSGELAADLVKAKAAKVGAIKAKEATLTAAGFTYEIPESDDPHTYQIDYAAQQNMTSIGALFALGQENAHGGFWRSMANVNVEMTDAQCIAFFKAAAAYRTAVVRNMWLLIAGTNAASDQTALDAETTAALALVDPQAGTIDGAGGWPT
jgi:hypothetical protein